MFKNWVLLKESLRRVHSLMVAVNSSSVQSPPVRSPAVRSSAVASGAVKSAVSPVEHAHVAVVLVRSWCGANPDSAMTLDLLRLRRKNFCVVLKGNAVNMGMIKKVKDYVTYGEISETTFDALVAKRGEEFKAPLSDAKGRVKSTTLEIKGKKYKPYFRMNPPRKGFGRKGVKIPFGVGGALGYRGEKMNDLVMRML